MVETFFRHSLEEVDQITLETQHNTLGFGVAHAAIVFDDFGLSVAIDEPEENEALISNVFCAKSVDGGANDFTFHLFHPFRCGERHGRNGAHAAGVEAGVAFANAFVVLGLGENFVAAAVGEDKDRAFDAGKELFDHHARRRVAKLAAEHFSERMLRFFKGGENQNSLAGAKSVGLQHVGSGEGGEKFATCFHLCAVEGAIGCSGNAMTLHKCLGKVF